VEFVEGLERVRASVRVAGGALSNSPLGLRAEEEDEEEVHVHLCVCAQVFAPEGELQGEVEEV
jgi:hypothetical protein